MKPHVKTLLFVSALVLITGFGCATSRGILNVLIPEMQDPTSGPAVTITRVTDKRVFEAAPRHASIPSLKGKEIDDKSLTSRAIARKRNAYGKALGDILLPEGRTVEDLVREALTKAFREAGYRVVEGTAAESADVVPIQADIEQFWAWITPGFWSASLQFESKVKIQGNVAPFTNGETVRGYVELHSQAPSSRAWQNTFNQGIDSLVSEVKNRLVNKK